MLSEKQIENRIVKYFEEKYSEHALTADIYPYPPPDAMKFDIPGLGKTITITCDPESGKVMEKREPMPPAEELSCDFDAYVKRPI